MKDEASICALAGAVAAGMAGKGNFVIHPYPVTRFHGDYLHHVDLAAAARARVLAAALPAGIGLRVKAGAAATDLVRTEWMSHDSDWDVSVETVNVDELLAASNRTLNGWIGPPWLVRDGFRPCSCWPTESTRQAPARRDRCQAARG